MRSILNQTFSIFLLALAGFSASGWAAASAGDIRCEVIKIVDPYPPGGSTGNIARLIAQKMSVDLGRTVIVENIGGASGNIGSAHVARAKPDGCTLLIGNDATHASNYHLFKSLPFHPVRDVTPITLAAKNIIVLVAQPSFPANSVKDLISYAKTNPEKLFFGSSGIGSPHHLAGALLNQLAGLKLVHTPYQNGPPALSDVLGGHIAMAFLSLSVAAPHIASGKLKVLGVTEKSRYPGLPSVPSISESIPDFEMTSWIGFFGPPSLSQLTLKTLHQSIAKGLNSSDVVDTLSNMGLLVVANSPEEFAIQQEKDFQQRGELIRRNNITLEN